MAVGARANENAPFELKSTSLSAIALVLKTADLAVLAAAMESQFGQTPDLFDHDPVVIDLTHLGADTPTIDFNALGALLRRQRMLPVAVRGGSTQQMEEALAAGLGAAAEGGMAPARPRDKDLDAAAAPVPQQPPARLAPAAASAGRRQTATAAADVPAAAAPVVTATMTIDRPLRSGQQIYAKGGDLVVLAAVNFGAEVLADGNIHVYGPLRGKAVAGVKGNTAARIFSTCMEPELVAIAGTYRTTETPLPDEVLGKPAQIRLDGDRLVFEPLL